MLQIMRESFQEMRGRVAVSSGEREVVFADHVQVVPGRYGSWLVFAEVDGKRLGRVLVQGDSWAEVIQLRDRLESGQLVGV